MTETVLPPARTDRSTSNTDSICPCRRRKISRPVTHSVKFIDIGKCMKSKCTDELMKWWIQTSFFISKYIHVIYLSMHTLAKEPMSPFRSYVMLLIE